MVQERLILMGVLGVAACGGATATSSAASGPAPETPLLVADATAPTSAGVVYMGSIVEVPPRLVARPRLIVPDSLTRRGIRGAVSLEYVVDTLGRVEPNIKVIATDHPLLVGPAKTMVAGMRYRPGRVRGRAVRVLLGTRVTVGVTGATR